MVPYLEGLAPDVMPDEGNDAVAAVSLAAGLLDGQDAPGAVLLVTDGLDPADAAALRQEGIPPLAVLAMLPDGARDRGLDVLGSIPVVSVTPDDSDVRTLDRTLNAAYRRAMAGGAADAAVVPPWLDHALGRGRGARRLGRARSGPGGRDRGPLPDARPAGPHGL